MERIPADNWLIHAGHVVRYEMAAALLRPGQSVLDAACGVGYGARVIRDRVDVDYVGVDQPGVPDDRFRRYGKFYEADLMSWTPLETRFDLGVCFETLEHVSDPQRLADLLDRLCDRLIVSVPTVPTVGVNPHHLHDFTLDDLLGLFARREPVEIVPQPEELSHIVTFGGRA